MRLEGKALEAGFVRGREKSERDGTKKEKFAVKISDVDRTAEDDTVCHLWQRFLCPHGDNCKFDHPEGGGGPKPASAKVKKCLEFSKKGRCSRGDACAFAHVAKEKVERIAADGPKPCFNWKKKGKCRKGDACKFAHS